MDGACTSKQSENNRFIVSSAFVLTILLSDRWIIKCTAAKLQNGHKLSWQLEINVAGFSQLLRSSLVY